MIICSIYDVRSDSLQGSLYTFPNKKVALRNFQMCLGDDAERLGLGLVKKYADDFYLVQVGELDLEHEGTLTAHYERLSCISDLLPKEECEINYGREEK